MISKIVNELRQLCYVARYALPFWRGWLLIVATSFVSLGLALLQPWPMKLAIDHVLRPVESGPPSWMAALPGADGRLGLLGWLIAAQAIVFLLAAAIDALVAGQWIRTGQAATYSLARAVFLRLLHRDVGFHTRHSCGDLLQRALVDTGCVQDLVGRVLLRPLTAGVMIVAVLVILLRMDVWLTLVLLLAAPLMALNAALMAEPLKRVNRRRSELHGELNAHVEQTLAGVGLVQALGQESAARDRLERVQGEALRNQRHGVMLKQFATLLTGAPPAVAVAVVLWMGASRVLDGALTLGALLVFLGYANTLKGRLKGLARSGQAVQSIRAEAERVAEVVLVEPEVSQRPDARTLDRVARRIEFQQVSYGYDPAHPVLHEVSFGVEPRQMLGLVGPTGAGKSTVALLLLRLIDPQQGRVLLDGHDMRDLRLQDVRRHLAFMPQEPLLLPMSVADNLAFGRPGASRQDIEAAARLAGAEEFIHKLPEGLDTLLAERGASLSGGQRQRLALARALVCEAPVLVLDEPTSALDAETEAAIWSAVETSGRTCIVIAHRLTTVRRADVVAVMEAGRIVETGTHEQLLGRKGLYHRLHAASRTRAVAPGRHGSAAMEEPVSV